LQQIAESEERAGQAVSIFKRGGKYWYHFMFDGKHVQRSTKQANRKAARDMESAYRTALAKGEVGITERKKAPGFKAAMKAFLAWSESEHKAHPATHRRYKVSSIALLGHFGDKSIDEITAEDVEGFKAARALESATAKGKEKGTRKSTGKRIRSATVNRELACLKALFNHALKSDFTFRNPVSRVDFLPENNEQTRVLTYDEQGKYLAAATPLLRDVATLMLETGMRPEEVYRIRPENVNVAGGFLFNPFGKTKAARRRVPLTSTARNVLTRRMAGLEAPFLFPCDTDAKRPVPKVNNAHDRAVKVSKVAKFRLYDLRHTWATRAAESGIDLVTLAALLGHSKIQMVLRYAHPTQEHQARSVERLEQFNAARQMEALVPEDRATARMIQ
jgi:integrase